MRQEEGELVAADPERRVGRADRLGDEGADLAEELVADGVAPRVVDALELVDVDEHEREGGAVAPRALDHPGDGLLEGAVVAKSGEAVAQRRLAGALVQLAQPRAGGLERARRTKDLAGHPDREAAQQREQRGERRQRLDGQRHERDRRGDHDLPAVDPGQVDRRSPVRVVVGHRREVEDLAGQGARVERVLGLGDERAAGVDELQRSAGRLDRRAWPRSRSAGRDSAATSVRVPLPFWWADSTTRTWVSDSFGVTVARPATTTLGGKASRSILVP